MSIPVPECQYCDVRGSVERTGGTEQWVWFYCTGCSARILVDREGIRKVLRGTTVLYVR